MGWAVLFREKATARTGSAAIARVHEAARDTCALRLIHDKGSQLPKAPTLMLVALAFANRRPVPDARQVFQGKGGLRVFSSRHKLFRNDVIYRTPKPGFSPGKPASDWMRFFNRRFAAFVPVAWKVRRWAAQR